MLCISARFTAFCVRGAPMNLTRKAIDAALPQATDVWLSDASLPGFHVRVQPSGRKTYVIRYRNIRGQSRKHTIARCTDIGLTEARDKARSLFVRIREGFDPSEAKIEARNAPTMNDVANRYMDEFAIPYKKKRSADNDRRIINKHILPLLGRKAVADLRKDDIVRLHVAMKDTPANANRTLTVVSKMVSLAIEWGWTETNPTRGVRRYKERKRGRILSTDEIRRLNEHLSCCDPETARFIRLLLLTGCRISEIRDARMEWVDFERRLLVLPDSKTGERVVALPYAALELLNQVRDRERVYDGPTVHYQWWKIRKAVGLNNVRLHDLRHTVGSVGHKAGLTLREIATLLGHRQLSTAERYVHGYDGDDVRAADVVAEAMGF